MDILLRLILTVAFILIMSIYVEKADKYSLSKIKYLTWGLGVIFTLIQPFNIFEFIFRNTFNESGPPAALLSIAFYVWISKSIIGKWPHPSSDFCPHCNYPLNSGNLELTSRCSKCHKKIWESDGV